MPKAKTKFRNPFSNSRASGSQKSAAQAPQANVSPPQQVSQKPGVQNKSDTVEIVTPTASTSATVSTTMSYNQLERNTEELTSEILQSHSASETQEEAPKADDQRSDKVSKGNVVESLDAGSCSYVKANGFR
jgi:hypothetical protein